MVLRKPAIMNSLQQCIDSKVFRRAVFLVAFLVGGGCGEKQRGGVRISTVPVTGMVLVDGEPAEGLQVVCHPQTLGQISSTISGYTNDAGEFSIGTYEAADGAPPGTYKLTFVWGQWTINGQYGGNDRLNKKYANTAESEFAVEIMKGKPCDLGVFALSSKL